MKFYSSFLLLIGFSTCATAKEAAYVGSTPANNVVRAFLGISLRDSVDFIRWKVVADDNKYSLQCNYGIGKPNTSGFWDGGKRISFDGLIKREGQYCFLQSGTKELGFVQLNNSIIHVVDEHRQLLVGTGGWSYTLNKVGGLPNEQINLPAVQPALHDSVTFYGRTPCWDFPLVHSSPQCVKKKWLIVLFADSKTNQPTTYHLNGNSRGEGGSWGKWQISKAADGRVIYQLYSEREAKPLELIVIDENTLAFADQERRILVGNEDFSFTLSKK